MNKVDQRVVPYVLGLLDEEHSSSLEQAMCEDDELRQQVTAVARKLDHLAKSEESMEAAPSVRACLLQSVNESAQMTAMLSRVQQLFDIESDQALGLLDAARDLTCDGWESAGISGAHLLHLKGGPTLAQADCGLVHFAAGAVFPLHEHLGDEWALVLEGCIGEVGGRQFNVGDVAFSAAGSQHALEVIGDRPVVLATVNFAGIQVQGPNAADSH